MGRVAATVLCVLAFGITDARAQQFAPSLVNDFRRVCLSDRPFKESLAEVGTVGRLVTPDGKTEFPFAESRETVPTLAWHREATGQERTSAYTIFGIRYPYRGREFKHCEVRTYFDLDIRSDLKPLIDDLAELEQPSSTIPDDIASMLWGKGRSDSDSAQWRVRHEPDSAVILYMLDGATVLKLIGPAE